MKKPFILALLFFSSWTPHPAGGLENNPPERQILTLSATGTERIEATVADVRLAIEERGRTDEEARERMAQSSNRLLEFLRGQRVEQLRTTSLRLHPIYDYTKGDREVVGFQAMSVIEFRTDVSDVAPIIDEALARGANQVQDLVFTAPDEILEEARQRALRVATRLALQRADAVLSELGLERRRIVRIHVDAPPPNGSFPIGPRMEMRALAADRTETDIEAGESEISASVTLVIGY